MRKTAAFILCFISVSAFAQLRVGIQAGYNISQFSSKGSNTQYYNLANINTFQAGLIAEEKLNNHFFAESGLSFAQKGSIRTTNTQYALDGGPNTTTKLNYLQIPLNLIYKVKLNTSLTALAGAGFYGAFGLSGSEKGTDENSSGTVSPVNNKIKFQNNTFFVANTTYVKPFDIGYNVFVGLEWKKSLQFRATINDGFKGIYPTGDTEFRNQVFNLSITYLVPWN